MIGRYFVLFLFFLWMACLYGVLILGKSFYHLMFDSPKSSSPRLPSMGPDLTSVRIIDQLDLEEAFRVKEFCWETNAIKAW